MTEHFFIPDWPAPDNVRSAITLRAGGVSLAPFTSNNLAVHVGDNAEHVAANRQFLVNELRLPCQPLWLDQVHGTDIVCAPEAEGTPSADASYADALDAVCAVLTADCLPVLLCNQSATQVAAAHAGWRGLSNGILRETVRTFTYKKDPIMAYLGPAIGPQVFEVGAEVMQAFLNSAQSTQHRQVIEASFKSALIEGKYLADLYALARAELAACGVSAVYGGEHCTFSQPEQFYSYRRDSKTGRNASLIWLQNDN